MRTFRILYFKELKGYFLSPFGWLILAFAALMQAMVLSLTLNDFIDKTQAQSLVHLTFISPFFSFYFFVLFPVLTMRLFSEESRSGTIEGLLTAPVKTWHVVYSKFGAAYTVYLTLWIPAWLHFKLFTMITDFPPPFQTSELYGALMIVALMGLLFTALGCLASALTSSQIIAGLVCLGLLLVHLIIGLVPIYIGESFAASPIFNFVSSTLHIRDFSRGLIDSRTFVYYLASTGFVLFLTHHLLDYRRWKP